MLLVRLSNVPSCFFRALLLALIALALSLIFARQCAAAPQAENSEECVIAADMALVAGALAQEGVEPALGERIMWRIYAVSTERGRALMALIVRVAYADKPDAQVYSEKLLRECLRNRGNMDGILGASS